MASALTFVAPSDAVWEGGWKIDKHWTVSSVALNCVVHHWG